MQILQRLAAQLDRDPLVGIVVILLLVAALLWLVDLYVAWIDRRHGDLQ